MKDFDYLEAGEVYVDAACQSLRPRTVMRAMEEYYTRHNSCGERVKYKWGIVTDEMVEETRNEVLKYLKLSRKDYTVSFTLNTTYGVNLILSQLKPGEFKKVMTSEIEHNSIFLSTMAFGERARVPREVMERKPDGAVEISNYDFEKAVVVVNAAANFDGRKLINLKELVKTVHKAGGIIIVDAAQAVAHSVEIVRKVEADAIVFSAHKMYGPSLGVIVWRDELLNRLDNGFLGGGMVDDVFKDKFVLSAEGKEHRYTRFEPGLQAWAEIIGFGAALKWLNGISKKEWQVFEDNYHEVYEFLKKSDKVRFVNMAANPTMSFYIEGIDSHLVGAALARENVMARTGYFCVHYYLDHVLKMPPLVRFSLGLHNTTEDVTKIKKVLGKMIGNK